MVNPGSSTLKFQALFHTYFRLPEGTLPSEVAIQDTLKGLRYKDKAGTPAEDTESRDTFTFVGETDRVYADAPNAIVAKYGKSQQGLKLEWTSLRKSKPLGSRAQAEHCNQPISSPGTPQKRNLHPWLTCKRKDGKSLSVSSRAYATRSSSWKLANLGHALRRSQRSVRDYLCPPTMQLCRRSSLT